MRCRRVVVPAILGGLTVWNILTACSLGPSRGARPSNLNVVAVVTGPSTLRVGETAQLSITLTFPDGRMTPVQPSQPTLIEVRSSDTRVLTVSASAEVRGISPGSAVVTVTPSPAAAENNNRVPGVITITVVP
jgi:hypothetical protein